MALSKVVIMADFLQLNFGAYVVQLCATRKYELRWQHYMFSGISTQPSEPLLSTVEQVLEIWE